MDSNSLYGKEYLSYLKNRSVIQLWARYYFFKSLRPYLKGNVLDLGCGIGEAVNHVDRNGKYWGVDINPYCVDYLKEKGVWADIGSAYRIPLADLSVDVVLFSHVLEHLDDPDRAMREISRVLKPLGLIIIIVPMIKGFHKDSSHQIFYNREHLRSLIERNQYQVCSISMFPLPFELLGKLLYFFEYRIVARKQAM